MQGSVGAYRSCSSGWTRPRASRRLVRSRGVTTRSQAAASSSDVVGAARGPVRELADRRIERASQIRRPGPPGFGPPGWSSSPRDAAVAHSRLERTRRRSLPPGGTHAPAQPSRALKPWSGDARRCASRLPPRCLLLHERFRSRRLVRVGQRRSSQPARATLTPPSRAIRRREPSTALGKPSVRAAADDRFARFDVVWLTIALATERSPAASGRPADGQALAPAVHEQASKCSARRARVLGSDDVREHVFRVGRLLLARAAGAPASSLVRLAVRATRASRWPRIGRLPFAQSDSGSEPRRRVRGVAWRRGCGL